MKRHPKVKAMATYSSTGNRPAQEDHVLVDQDKKIFVIADGFGGPAPGKAAAEAACDAVKSFLFKEAGDLEATLPFELRSYFSLAGNVLFNALIHANRRLNKLNGGKNVHEKGGASVLAGFVDEDLLAVANVGGCTAWLARAGAAAELVRPRTYGALVDPFSAATGRGSAGLSAPLMALGMAKDLEPEIFEYRLVAGDWLFLQTDGVSAELRERVLAMQAEGAARGNPTRAAEEALQMLREATYEENAAAALVIF